MLPAPAPCGKSGWKMSNLWATASRSNLVRRAVQEGLTVAEVPITFVERTRGASKMSKAIVGEALWRVTGWGIARRLRSPRPRMVPSQGLQARTGTKKGASQRLIRQRGRLRPDASSTPRARE